MILKHGKTYLLDGLEELILLKWIYYPRQSTDLMQSLSKHQWHFFFHKTRMILEFVWKHKRPWIAKGNLRKKNKARGIMYPHFKLYYKVTLIKIVCYWHKNKHIDQWNRIQSLEMHPHLFGWLMYDKSALIYNEEKIASSINSVGKCVCKRVQTGLLSQMIYKNNSQWVKNLNIISVTIILLEENKGRTLFNISLLNILGVCFFRQGNQKQK